MIEPAYPSWLILKSVVIFLVSFITTAHNVTADDSLFIDKSTITDSLFAKDNLYLQFAPQSGIPVPPAYCITRQAKAGFIARNWWKNTKANDFYLYSHTEKATEGEQKLVDFLSFLPLCDSVSQQYALYFVLNLSADCDTTNSSYYWVNNLLEKYLWDEESPMYNETLYSFVLRYRASRPEEETGSKMRAAMLLPKILQNQIGTRPNDLLLGLSDGSNTTLYELLPKFHQTDYILLLFYDLDCAACQEVINEISRISSQFPRLSIITIQLHSQDIPAWKSYIRHLPADWTHTYDVKEAVFMEETYYMRNSSALYLLDNQGIIRLKNTRPDSLREYLFAH